LRIFNFAVPAIPTILAVQLCDLLPGPSADYPCPSPYVDPISPKVTQSTQESVEGCGSFPAPRHTQDSELRPTSYFTICSPKDQEKTTLNFCMDRSLILLSVRPLKVIPSPSSQVAITPFDETLYPAFKKIFEPQPEDSRLRHFARDPSEIPLSLVLENRSEKAITGLSYRWRKLEGSGNLSISSLPESKTAQQQPETG
jgi:hypothetical protein